MKKRIKSLSSGLLGIVAALLLTSYVLAASSPNYALNWYGFGASGGQAVASSNYRLDTTIGEGIAGNTSSTNYRAGLGYQQIYGALGATPTGTAVATSTSTSTATRANTVAATSTSTVVATSTSTVAATSTAAPTGTSTVAATNTVAATSTAAATGTSTVAATNTVAATSTAVATQTPGGSTATTQPSSTVAATSTSTVAATNTAAATSTVAATSTAVATQTPGGSTATAQPSSTVAATGTSTVVATNTAAATSTVAATQTPGGPTTTAQPSSTAAATNTVAATAAASSTPCGINYSDVPTEYWAYGYIKYISCNGWAQGYSDGSFRPNTNINRAEFSKLVGLAYAVPRRTPATPTYSDVPANYWAYGYIEGLSAAGIIAGFGNGQFRPNQLITRAEMVKMVVVANGNPLLNPATPTYGDVPANYWAYRYIETATNKQWVGGFTSNSFRPNNTATRAELSKLIYLSTTFPLGRGGQLASGNPVLRSTAQDGQPP